MSQEDVVRTRKMRALKGKGYRRVGADLAGRIVVEVKEEHFLDPELFRRVWGLEWPVVRSEPWRKGKKIPAESQFEFHSREY